MRSSGTLRGLIEGNYTLHVHCEAKDCHNHGPVDIEALERKLGPDHGSLATDLKPYFRCSKCGSRRVGFTLGTKGHGHAGYGGGL